MFPLSVVGMETSSAVVALTVAFLFSQLIAPRPNFPLVNYLRHNGHSARPPTRKQSRPKPKSFAPGSLRGSSSTPPPFRLTKTDHFLPFRPPSFDWPLVQCIDFICGHSLVAIAAVGQKFSCALGDQTARKSISKQNV